MESNRGIVQKGWEAFNNRDWDQLGMNYALDATLTDPLFPLPFIGKASILQHWKDWTLNVPDARASIQRTYAGVTFVVVEVVGMGTFQKGMPGIPEGVVGKSFRLDMISIHELEEGKIIRHAFFYDTGVLMKQLGLLQ